MGVCLNELEKKPAALSIVIPVCNEAEGLPFLLKSLEALEVDEVIFVDCGSLDDTAALLKIWATAAPGSYDRKSLVSKRGRANQMNAGAEAAMGDIILFLHADTTLPHGGIHVIRECMKNPGVVGGAFRLKIDSPHFFLKGVEKIANLRAFYGGLPYGDQAYFVRREVFQKMGGYRVMPLMEDVEFIRRLKKEGKIVLLEKAVRTSARRWEKQGYFYTSFRNMVLLGLYFFGVSPSRLAKWYDA